MTDFLCNFADAVYLLRSVCDFLRSTDLNFLLSHQRQHLSCVLCYFKDMSSDKNISNLFILSIKY